jgi:hypothetical protein
MAAGGRGIDVQLDQQAIAALFHGHDSPVGRDLQQRGERGAQSAKRHCPVSPVGASDHPSGQLRSAIGWEPGEDGEGLYVDVGVDPSSPAAAYALPVELGARPHVIESHGDYPLRDRKGNVFGRSVQHPGNPAQPYLQPAIDDMR